MTDTFEKPMRVPLREFLINSNLKTLPCISYSPKANLTTKQVFSLEEMDFETHLLCMCPAKWVPAVICLLVHTFKFPNIWMF